MGINNNKHYLLNDFENSFFPFYIKFILNNILYLKNNLNISFRI